MEEKGSIRLQHLVYESALMKQQGSLSFTIYNPPIWLEKLAKILQQPLPQPALRPTTMEELSEGNQHQLEKGEMIYTPRIEASASHAPAPLLPKLDHQKWDHQKWVFNSVFLQLNRKQGPKISWEETPYCLRIVINECQVNFVWSVEHREHLNVEVFHSGIAIKQKRWIFPEYWHWKSEYNGMVNEIVEWIMELYTRFTPPIQPSAPESVDHTAIVHRPEVRQHLFNDLQKLCLEYLKQNPGGWSWWCPSGAAPSICCSNGLSYGLQFYFGFDSSKGIVIVSYLDSGMRDKQFALDNRFGVRQVHEAGAGSPYKVEGVVGLEPIVPSICEWIKDIAQRMVISQECDMMKNELEYMKKLEEESPMGNSRLLEITIARLNKIESYLNNRH